MKRKPSPQTSTTMVSDLADYTEIELLEFTKNILVQLGEVTSDQKDELEAINNEFRRREKLELKVA